MRKIRPTPNHLKEKPEHYVQFLAPLTGSRIKRDGKRDVLMNFSGLMAEKLRHVDLLLHQPWKARISSGGEQCELQVVNPVAYLIQKLLVLPGRGQKQGKDLLYIFDTLAIFGSSLSHLGEAASSLVPKLSTKTISKIRTSARSLCFVETKASHEAARIAQSQRARPPGSSQIVGACELGLRRMLSSLALDL